MAEESKEIDPQLNENAIQQDVETGTGVNPSKDDAEDEVPDSAGPDALAAGAATKKKKSKKAKLKKALGVENNQDPEASSSSNPASKLTNNMVEQLLEMNPSLKSEVAGMDKGSAAEAVRRLDVADLLTGMVCHIELMSELQVADIFRSP